MSNPRGGSESNEEYKERKRVNSDNVKEAGETAKKREDAKKERRLYPKVTSPDLPDVPTPILWTKSSIKVFNEFFVAARQADDDTKQPNK
jgi:hypothetical protein